MLIGGRKRGGKIMNRAIRIAVYCALIIGGLLSSLGYYLAVGLVLAFVEILINFTVEFNKDNLTDNMKQIFDLILFVSIIMGAIVLFIRTIFGYPEWFEWFTRITLAILIIVTIIMTVINFIIGFKPNKNSD